MNSQRKFTSSKISVFLEHQFFYSDFWEQVFFLLISRNRSYILLYYLLYSFFPELSSIFEVYYSVIVEISTATKCSTFPYYYYGFSEWYFVFSEQCSGLLELTIPTNQTQLHKTMYKLRIGLLLQNNILVFPNVILVFQNRVPDFQNRILVFLFSVLVFKNTILHLQNSVLIYWNLLSLPN